MVFPTFFNLSLNLALRSSWSEPQLAPSLVFAEYINLSIFGCKEYNQSDFNIDPLVMSMCTVFSYVLEEGVCYDLGKALLAFALLHFVLQGQICLLLQVPLDFLLTLSSFLNEILLSFQQLMEYTPRPGAIRCILENYYFIWELLCLF